jgi:hypothetical protein
MMPGVYHDMMVARPPFGLLHALECRVRAVWCTVHSSDTARGTLREIGAQQSRKREQKQPAAFRTADFYLGFNRNVIAPSDL